MSDFSDLILSYVRPHCVTDVRLLLLSVSMNIWIGVSYIQIPNTIHRILRRVGGRITAKGEARGFALFVRSCGITHLFLVGSLFIPSLDWIAIIWCVWTGFISWKVNKLISRREDVLVQAILDAQALSERVSGSSDNGNE